MIPRNTPQSVQDAPIVQWASGRTEARPAGHSRYSGLVGFHSEVGKDAAFDAACQAAGVAQVTIRHPREGGPAVEVLHWSFGETLAVYPLTAGPPYRSLVACLKSARTAEAGLGLVWPQGERSRLAVRCYILVGDAPHLVQLSVRSTMTDHLLAALIAHVRACEAADALIDRAKHPDVVALYELALPLGPGAEVAAGKRETTTIVPLAAQHPAPLTAQAIRAARLWRPESVAQAALTDWPDVVAWAAEYCSGATNGDSHV